MNQFSQTPSKSQNLQSAEPKLSAVNKLLNEAQLDLDLALDFSESLNLAHFQLGELIYVNKNTKSENCDVHTEHNKHNFYLVCQGKVRLLSWDKQRQRELSVQVLEAGETFGAEELFCPSEDEQGNFQCLPYKAIAASDSQVANLSIEQLSSWLERLADLREYLRQQTQRRHCQIFLKTATDLRCLPSHVLRELLPYLTPLRVSAGESLVKATPPDAGRYWLYRGQLSGTAEDSIGLSWGYPDSKLPDATLETDSLIYYLAKENWQIAQSIAPKYFQTSADPISSSGHQVNQGTNKKQRKAEIRTIVSSAIPSPETAVANTPNESVDFPKPIKRFHWPWQRYPLVLQQSSSDCGAACLAMISQYWGKRFSLNYLRNLAGVGRDGASLTKGLAKAAENLGFMARPVRASFGKLAEQQNPWIAHWQGIHYVVVYRCKGNRVLIADPAKGKFTISRQEFVQNWSGYALLLDPTPRLKNAESQKISLGKFVGALLPYRYLIGQVIFASLLLQIFGVITPLFTQIILDQVVVNKSLATLNVFILGLLLFNLWSLCLGVTRQYLLDYFSNRFDLTLIGGFVSHTLSLPLRFFESRRVGDIITRVQENSKIQKFLTRQVILTWLDMVMGFVYVGLMLYYNFRLTLLVLALIPPIAILTLVATPLLQKMSREIFNESAEQNSLLVEMLTGVATVKAMAAEREIRWRWEDRFTSTLNVVFKTQKLGYVLQSTSSLINSFGSTALLWFGATLVIQDELTIGQFVAFNMMIGKVIGPVLAVVGIWNQMQEVLISVERLNDVFEAEPEETPGKPMLTLPRLRGEVQFDNVTFRYGSQGEKNTLQNISFVAMPGQTIAIVGRSGSGKSTLVSMLQGFYHPDSGRILVDGYDIRHVSPQSLRSQLGVVPQETFLFSGTILENIALYRPEFTLEEVTEAAKLAEAHAFIQDLPLGYNTKVGERGSSLSGGQRQRIAIARALLGNPRILVLDEATSSLDTESERRFQQNLERLSRDRTTFIIAHRLSTVRNADCILVLDRGILTETGNHEQLMTQGGLYYHLAQQQLVL
ncbi:ABC transporter transmembrane domain-containing protein [Aerosakkonemataceae cyanobacterium BLCC-F154]|uniref:ABC transporter transmembrane domain-containing protein n=1 Tax=Floridaenema fluviatile BLCC-F154 TaxID=3153640 RepID=A0ABV4Y743_9CYAN